MNNYKLRWILWGSILFAFLSIGTLFFHYFFDMGHYQFHWYEFISIFVMTFAGAIFGYNIGSYKYKDMQRAGWLRQLGKKFLHEARNHLAIITGYASIIEKDQKLINNEEINMIDPILKRATLLGILIKENLERIEKYEGGKNKSN